MFLVVFSPYLLPRVVVFFLFSIEPVAIVFRFGGSWVLVNCLRYLPFLSFTDQKADHSVSRLFPISFTSFSVKSASPLPRCDVMLLFFQFIFGRLIALFPRVIDVSKTARKVSQNTKKKLFIEKAQPSCFPQ